MTEILNRTNLVPVASTLPTLGFAALLCVERDPEACHRSLIARRLADQYGITVRISTAAVMDEFDSSTEYHVDSRPPVS